jgi:hypothetical protein
MVGNGDASDLIAAIYDTIVDPSGWDAGGLPGIGRNRGDIRCLFGTLREPEAEEAEYPLFGAQQEFNQRRRQGFALD